MTVHHYGNLSLRVPFAPRRGRPRLRIATDGMTARISRIGLTRRHLALCRRQHGLRAFVDFDVRPAGGAWHRVRIVACARCGAKIEETRHERP